MKRIKDFIEVGKKLTVEIVDSQSFKMTEKEELRKSRKRKGIRKVSCLFPMLAQRMLMVA